VVGLRRTWSSGRIWLVSGLAVLLAGCSPSAPSIPDTSLAPSTRASSSVPTTPAAVASKGSASTRSSAPTSRPRDVTLTDLMTAVSPPGCSPSQRMVGGKVPGGVPINEVELGSGHGWSPQFVDLAGLGYRQILSVFVCGGANPVPEYLMLTGHGGELLGSIWLGDFESAAHTSVLSLRPEASGVTVDWVATQAAGSDPTMHTSRISFTENKLRLVELVPANVLGIPLAHVLRPKSGDASFVSPTGKLACALSARDAHCEGMSLTTAPGQAYCQAPVGGIDGPLVNDDGTGWHCASQQTVFPFSDQAWWQGHGFATANSRIGGDNAAVLPYGWVVEVGGLACRSESTGITCAQVISGTGFRGNDRLVEFLKPSG